jgi:hypothetical protein
VKNKAITIKAIKANAAMIRKFNDMPCPLLFSIDITPL